MGDYQKLTLEFRMVLVLLPERTIWNQRRKDSRLLWQCRMTWRQLISQNLGEGWKSSTSPGSFQNFCKSSKYSFKIVVYLQIFSGSMKYVLKGAQSRLKGLNSLAILFNFGLCNPRHSSPSLTTLVPLWFIVVSLMFFYLCKVLCLGFLQFNGYFVDA